MSLSRCTQPKTLFSVFNYLIYKDIVIMLLFVIGKIEAKIRESLIVFYFPLSYSCPCIFPHTPSRNKEKNENR